MQKKRFAYLAVLLMLGSGFALIGVASATTPTSNIQGFTTSYVPYQFTNFTIADINYNFTTTVGSVFLPANNFTGGYFDSLSGNLMKINLETGKYTTLSPLSGFQNAVYNYGNYAMTYYGIMPFYNSSNVLTHISQFALLSNTSKFVFFDYNVLNGTHHTIFTDITNSETQYNVQANYLGNGLFSVITQNYTLSVFSIYTGKEISHLSLDFFEANNIYWFPQWRVFLNVHAGGSTANDVQTVYVSSTGQIQSNGTSTIYSGSFTDNGVPDAVSYGNQVYFQMQDTATAPNLNVILKYSNGTFSLVRNWLVTPVPVSWITGGYNFGPGNAYVPIQTSNGWLSSTIGGSGINPALTWNPFTNQSANNTNGFPDARTLYDYTANSYNSQGYYLGTGQFALSPYHFAYNGSAYFYYPEMRNGTGAFKLLFGWQYGYSEYISSELTAYTTQTTKYTISITGSPSGSGYYQQLFTLDPATYGINYAGSNFYVTAENGTPYYSWVQSANTTSIQFWTKLPNGTTSAILEVFPSFENLFSANGYLGYGREYFNAPLVFPYATDFSNLSGVGLTGSGIKLSQTSEGLNLLGTGNGTALVTNSSFAGSYSLFEQATINAPSSAGYQSSFIGIENGTWAHYYAGAQTGGSNLTISIWVFGFTTSTSSAYPLKVAATFGAKFNSTLLNATLNGTSIGSSSRTLPSTYHLVMSGLEYGANETLGWFIASTYVPSMPSFKISPILTPYGVYNLSQFGPWNTLYYGQPQPQGGSVPSNVGNVTVGWDNGTLGAPAVYIYSMGHYNWLINNLNLNASSSYYINGSFFGYNQYSAFQVNYNGYLSFQMQYGYAYYNFSNHGTQQQYGKKANYSMFFNRTAETVTVTLTGLSTFVVTDVSSIQSLGLEYGYGQYPTQMVASVPTVTQIIVPIPVPVVYSYRIYETGLVLGSPFSTTSTWSINWNGTTYSSSVNYIEITTDSTSITFLVYGVDGYSVNHRIITVAETGNNTIYSDLNFTQDTNTTPYSIGLLWSYFPYIFTTVLVASIFIPVGLLVRRARRKDR